MFSLVVQYNPFGDLSTVSPSENRRVMNNGSLIAGKIEINYSDAPVVSYEARSAGVNRFMRGSEAKKVCPELQLIQVPVAHGKADINIYRLAGERVVEVITSRYRFPLPQHSHIYSFVIRCVVEKASVDEVYIDITEEALHLLHNTSPESFISDILTPVIDSKVIISLNTTKSIPLNPQGNDDDIAEDEAGDIDDICSSENTSCATSPDKWLYRPLSAWYPSHENEDDRDSLLVCASFLVNQIRKDIFDQLGYTCSAGIAHTKLLAKVSLSVTEMFIDSIRWHPR